MAKRKQAKKSKGKAKKPAAAKAKAKKKAPPAELAALKAAAKGAQAGLAKAKSEAEALRKKAADIEAKAKDAYRVAVAPYRQACRKAGVNCEFAGARAPNVAPAMRFFVEKVKGGVKVMVKGKPETTEVISLEVLRRSVGKAALAYAEKHVGPRERWGNKQGTISNKLRTVLGAG